MLCASEVMLRAKNKDFLRFRTRISYVSLLRARISHVCDMSHKELQVSFAEYSLFYRALLQKRPIIISTYVCGVTHE